MKTEEFRKIWTDVKANQAKLATCQKHAFERQNTDNHFSKFKCAHCGGTVDFQAAHWYLLGLKHARP